MYTKKAKIINTDIENRSFTEVMPTFKEDIDIIIDPNDGSGKTYQFTNANVQFNSTELHEIVISSPETITESTE
ncbi:8304_t:CDS:2 [Cetraspora pellucida]|uniref:8304_t:CDS:1 n=1 Tax=Cetraspora pellucida TaxID=1433469 RepID=A0A9N9BDE9_9GLOM|nr:8304_t:CDS:2 [Cetraspora pellucida]